VTAPAQVMQRSLEALAQLRAPFDNLELLIQRLVRTSKEGKYLEWKQHPPLGASVTPRAKYRTVKAVLSFANWEGGFVVFGVDPAGRWVGLDRTELASVDPAAISELVNGCVFPEIPDLNYAEFERDTMAFAVLHVPPSANAPHITTKPFT
jgi:hypothetical protein